MTEQVKANTEVSEFKESLTTRRILQHLGFQEAQAFVGGTMLSVSLGRNGDLLIVNEEGKLIGLPLLNPEATMLWRMTFDNDKLHYRT